MRAARHQPPSRHFRAIQREGSGIGTDPVGKQLEGENLFRRRRERLVPPIHGPPVFQELQHFRSPFAGCFRRLPEMALDIQVNADFASLSMHSGTGVVPVHRPPHTLTPNGWYRWGVVHRVRKAGGVLRANSRAAPYCTGYRSCRQPVALWTPDSDETEHAQPNRMIPRAIDTPEDWVEPAPSRSCPPKTGWLEHSLASCSAVVAPDALHLSTKAGSVEGIQHNLDRREIEMVAAHCQVVTLTD